MNESTTERTLRIIRQEWEAPIRAEIASLQRAHELDGEIIRVLHEHLWRSMSKDYRFEQSAADVITYFSLGGQPRTRLLQVLGILPPPFSPLDGTEEEK